MRLLVAVVWLEAPNPTRAIRAREHCRRDTMISTCSHAHPSFRVTNGPRHILLCWECVLDEIQESKIDQAILIVREVD